MQPLTTSDDIAYAAAIRDRDIAAARHRNDAMRGVTRDDAGEIAMLERALSGDLSTYSAAGIATMRGRVAVLREAEKQHAGLTVPVLQYRETHT